MSYSCGSKRYWMRRGDPAFFLCMYHLFRLPLHHCHHSRLTLHYILYLLDLLLNENEGHKLGPRFMVSGQLPVADKQTLRLTMTKEKRKLSLTIRFNLSWTIAGVLPIDFKRLMIVKFSHTSIIISHTRQT